jgi:hypothetical protein
MKRGLLLLTLLSGVSMLTPAIKKTKNSHQESPKKLRGWCSGNNPFSGTCGL